MPRLTNRDYLTHRHLLIEFWNEMDGGVFAELPGRAQRDLHDFYAPSESLTDGQALAHRVAMTAAFPSLPQKAGRAFEALRAHRDGRPNPMIEHRKASMRQTYRIGTIQKARAIRVMGLVRPTPEVHSLAKVLLQLALDDWDQKHPDVHLDEEITIDKDEDLSR